jgi:hypothetical protein
VSTWRFYQGLRTEWRWYRVDNRGNVIAESDRGFAELQGCMANAETAGFAGDAFQVYTRQAGSFGATHAVSVDDSGKELTEVSSAVGADTQAAS